MTARRAVRRFSRNKKMYLWSTVVIDQLATLTTVVDAVMLRPDDWERSSTTMESAKIVAVRGWLSVGRVLSNSGNVFMNMSLYDEDEASTLADIAAGYDSEITLWSDGANSGGFANTVSTHLGQINVKVSRKITSATELRFVTTSSGNGLYLISGLLRTLVQLN